MKIAIVEKNEDIAEGLKSVAESMGAETILKKCTQSAKNLLYSEHLDVMLINKHINGVGNYKDVIEIAKEAMKMNVNTIIISTDNNLIDCDTYIKAPFDLCVLENALISKKCIDTMQNLH